MKINTWYLKSIMKIMTCPRGKKNLNFSSQKFVESEIYLSFL